MRSSLAIGALVGAAAFGLASEAAAQERFALQMFHFNVQYVCGGTLGYTVNPEPSIDLNNDEIEDLIITESFEPIVDLFEKHPTWGVDLEMQAYMLDIIAARHPALLDKLRTMAKSGQVDVLSFHYSDQLFIGYPQEDWLRSQALTADTFAKHDIPLSKSVFCQEGQAAPAMAQRMEAAGYTTMIWPKNLWRYQHGDFDAQPYYGFGNIELVAGAQGVNFDDGTQTIDVQWTFFDDGELLATGDLNPYFPDIFRVDEASVAEYEDRLLALEADGVQITTVGKYVEAAKALVQPATLPPLLDGTWQPNSTGGVRRWAGGAGLWHLQERDNLVRSLGVIAHRELVAAEQMNESATLDARAELDAAWRLMFLGQVTDATGINPFRGEIQYGASHLTEATRIAREVIARGKTALGHGSVVIDPSAGSVTASSADPWPGGSSVAPLFDLTTDAGDRTASVDWAKLDEGHHLVTVRFAPGEGRKLGVVFPGTLEDTLRVSLALDDENPATVERSAFTFETFHFALPTGLIGLGGGRYVIKDMAQVHLAAVVERDAGDVAFSDETADEEDEHVWQFHVFDGSAEDAAALAIRLNSNRSLLR